MTQAKGDPVMTADDRLIVALDVPNVVQGLELAARIGDAASFYKIGLGMLTGGGLALANELKQDQGKRIFLDMKLFDIGATIEAAVRGIARYDLDFLTVHGDPQVVRAAMQGSAGSSLRILAVTILTSLDRADLDANMIRAGDYVFVHAGIDPARALADQKRSDLLWIRERFLSHEGPLEKVVVHGHTIFDEVMDCGNRIGIDTGAFRSGVLTALVLEGDQRRIIQACSEDNGPVEIFHGDRAR